jgi:hypothetical protein
MKLIMTPIAKPILANDPALLTNLRTIKNQSVRLRRIFPLLGLPTLVLFLALLSGCRETAGPREQTNNAAYDPSTGLSTYSLERNTSFVTVALSDNGQVLVAFQIPTRRGQFITDSTTLTGGSIMIDVQKAIMTSHTVNDSLANQWLAQIRQNHSAKTDSSMILKLNTVSPAPLKTSIIDSGKLADPTHLISAGLDRGDTALILNFGTKVSGMPQGVTFVSTLNTSPMIWGFKSLPKAARCQVTISVNTAKLP